MADRNQGVTVEKFGETPDGQTVDLYTLTSENGIEVQVMTYGATIVSIKTPDRQGKLENIVLRLDTFDAYHRGHPALGSTIGRFANRIGGGGFSIDGERYDLESCNRHGVQIHGGKTGWGKQIWDAEIREHEAFGPFVRFSHRSPDRQEGFPGNVTAHVDFLVFDNRLAIDYRAETDKPTHINMTNHAYFNLSGAGSGDVLDHRMIIEAEDYLALDPYQVPTGEILSVEDTPLDFRKPHTIGERIEQVPGGYDHCYVLWTEPESKGRLQTAARVVDPKTGRTMEVATTQPGVQLYTANGLSDRFSWRGKKYGPHYGFCLETQHFPDSPNRPEFPSTVIRPGGETYDHTTLFVFGIDR